MLGHGGVAKAQEFGELADRAFTIDQLADDEQPMAIGQGFQEFARGIGRGFHDIDIHFHTCVYTMVRIYSQPLRPE